MTRIVLANLSSPANPGDFAILKGSLKLLRSFFPDPEITLVTRAISEKPVYEKLGCRVIASYPNVDALAMDSTLEKIMNVPKALASPGLLKEPIRNADYVFLAGGAYFYSYRSWLPGFTFAAHLTPLYWAKQFQKPAILLPQSYGPVDPPAARYLFKRALEGANVAFYRESISGDWLKKFSPEIKNRSFFMPDLALYLESKDLVSKTDTAPENKLVGITVRPWSEAARHAGGYLQILTEALERLHRRFQFKFRIIPQVYDQKKMEGDEAFSRELYNRVSQKIGEANVDLCTANPYFDLGSVCRLYQDCEFLISMRLHSALLAFILGRPALVVGYQHKAEGMLKSLGLSQLYAGVFDEVKSDALEHLCESVWQERETWKIKIAEALKIARSETDSIFRNQMSRIGNSA